MVRVTLQPAAGTQGQAIDIDAGASMTANIGQLEDKLGLDMAEKNVIVLDVHGVAVQFKHPADSEKTPSVAEAKYYSVMTLQDAEKDAMVVTRVGVEDQIGAALEGRVQSTEHARVQRASMAVYAHGYAAAGEALQFPDHNQAFRQAYAGGLDAQVPDTYSVQATAENTLQTKVLRNAFQLGMAGKNDATKAVPATEDLREAYKRGKEQVYLSIPDQAQWANVNKDTFKLCSVPVEYAQYLGGVSQQFKDQAVYRDLLRQFFHLGVDDAWTARADVHVSDQKAIDRVPVGPNVQEAYADGVKAAKIVESHAAECSLKWVEENGLCKVVLVQGPDSENGACHLVAQGLNAAADKVWKELAPTHPDIAVPDTSSEMREKVKLAYAEKMKRDKELEKEKKEEERAAAAALAEVELTMWESIVKPMGACYDACCPCMTWKDGEPCTCLGTSCGDWSCILLLFALYYCYLGMWYWAFIEILMTVAEPQRPW